MQRFIALVWNVEDVESAALAKLLRLKLLQHPEWSVASDDTGALIVHERPAAHRTGCVYRLAGNSGAVVGRLFSSSQREYSAPEPVEFDQAETRRIVSSGGRHLIENYWGTYAALIHDKAAGKCYVLHDPTGSMPCYWLKQQRVHIFCNDIEDCVSLVGTTPAPNDRFLRHWLLSGALLSRETGLEGVQELSIGESAVVCKGEVTRTLVWNPVEIARTVRFENTAEAAREMRATIQATVDAWARCYDRITHELSGGLDSSIVAACLARTPSKPQVTYLNWALDIPFEQELIDLAGVDAHTADKLRALSGTGDERYFARLVAQQWKVELLEKCVTTSTDLSGLWNAPLRTRPFIYMMAMYINDVEMQLIREHGTQAFFSGQEGDSLFLATVRPMPAIDFAYLHGLSRGLWKHILSATRLSRDSLLSVLGRTLNEGILRRARSSSTQLPRTLLPDTLLGDMIKEDLMVSPLEALTAHANLPPGKIDHVTGIGSVGFHHGANHTSRLADHVHPLNSQPVWELVLQIPTYLMQAGGASRGLARQAFAEVLPAEIRRRQMKGSGSPFLQQQLRRNRKFLQILLLDGLLVRGGHVDGKKLHDCLVADEPFLLVDPSHLGRCLAAEIWLRSWERRREATASSTASRLAVS